jgi:hypothetical protein
MFDAGLFDLLDAIPCDENVAGLIAVYCSFSSRATGRAASLVPSLLASGSSDCVEFGLIALQCLLSIAFDAGLVFEHLCNCISTVFESGNAKLGNLILQTLPAAESLPLSLFPIVLHSFSSFDSPKTFTSGCLVFRRQVSVWKGLDDEAVCECLLRRLERQDSPITGTPTRTLSGTTPGIAKISWVLRIRTRNRETCESRRTRAIKSRRSATFAKSDRFPAEGSRRNDPSSGKDVRSFRTATSKTSK